jgi:hypothetical protein
MKKSERKAQVRKRAPEYAKSGEFSSWLSIEHRLTSEGYPEARGELDDHIIRQQLDSLCKTAQSSEETERRIGFRDWLDMVVHEIGPQLQNAGIKVSVSVYGNSLSVSGNMYSLEIRRRFNTMQLEYSKAVESKTGSRYRFGFESISMDMNYDSIAIENLEKLILKLCDSANSLAKQM